MSNPKISVILIYTQGQNLSDCILSLINQSFVNIEIICVNNGAPIEAEKLAIDFSKKDERIKLMSLPLGLDSEKAKMTGIFSAVGEFVIFIENNEVLDLDFVKDKYWQMQQIEKEKHIKLEINHLYRRTFVENDIEISKLLEDKFQAELLKYTEFTENIKQKLLLEFDKLNKNALEHLKNNTNEIIQRFNALEKEFYQKEWKNQERLKTLENAINKKMESKFDDIFCDISNIKSSLNNKIQEKTDEIKSVNEEIVNTKNSIEDLKKDMLSEINSLKKTISELDGRLYWQEKELYTRYVNLKRIMDLQFDEVKSRLKGE